MRKCLSEVLRVRNDLAEVSRIQEVFAGLCEDWQLPPDLEMQIGRLSDHIESLFEMAGVQPN